MAGFLTELRARLIGEDEWALDAPLVYNSDVANMIIRVPNGFVTDFASVPRLPLAYLLTGDTAHKAAVIHDYLYRSKKISRKNADLVFLEAMKETGIPMWRRYSMFLAVRTFGWTQY